MSSDPQSDTQGTSKKMRNRRAHSRNRQVPSVPSPQPTPQAPGELDAMLGYGTSSSFPLFMAGLVSLVKKAFGRHKT